MRVDIAEFIAPLIVCGVAGFVLFFFWITNDPAKTSEESESSKRYHNEMEKRMMILRRLSKSQVRRLHKITHSTLAGLGLPPEKMPDEMLMVSAAAAKVLEENTSCKLTDTQQAEISGLLNRLERHISLLLPAATKAMDQAADEGLGFGILTNNVADAALYEIMDARTKDKNYEKMIRAANQELDTQIKVVLKKIEEICKKGTE